MRFECKKCEIYEIYEPGESARIVYLDASRMTECKEFLDSILKDHGIEIAPELWTDTARPAN